MKINLDTATKITMGTLIGKATGDAFGVPVEFMSRAEVRATGLTEMVGADTGMPFDSRWGTILPAGAWSDDTSMAVAAMFSIADNGGKIDYEDIMGQFINWWDNAWYCSLDTAFGLGGTVSRALHNYRAHIPATECGPTDIRANGNGSLMRILPFSLYCIFKGLDDDSMVELISTASGITHGHPISKMGCVIFTVFLRNLISTHDAATAWAKTQTFNFSKYFNAATTNVYSALFAPDFVDNAEEYIGETGYVVDTLMIAVYSMLVGHNYESSILAAVNMGYDTDTSGAVTGALAGAFYGHDSIPERWTAKLRKRDELEELARYFAKSLLLHE